MIFEHEVTACPETDGLIHELLGTTGDPPRYSRDAATAKNLAKGIGLEIIPMHEPSHSHFIAAWWGVLPETEPLAT